MVCGFRYNCVESAANLTAFVEESAAAWDPGNASQAAALQRMHEVAKLSCEGAANRTGTIFTTPKSTTLSGGWCLGPLICVKNPHHSGGIVALPNNQSFCMPGGHYNADQVIAGVVAALLQRRLAVVGTERIETGSSHRHKRLSLNDFGAGVGQCTLPPIALSNAHSTLHTTQPALVMPSTQSSDTPGAPDRRRAHSLGARSHPRLERL